MLESNMVDFEKQFRDNLVKLIQEKQHSIHSILNAPSLYMSRQHFTKMMTRIKLFEKIKKVEGSIVECGVYQGESIATFFHLSNILEPFGFTRKIIGFDTFEGFPPPKKNTITEVNSKDDPLFSRVGNLGDTDYSEILEVIKIQEANRPINNINKIELIKGDARNTIPAYCEDNPQLIVSLLYLDFDLYEATKVALENFLPRVPIGGIVGFDELNEKMWVGETIALNEVIGINKVRLRKFTFDPHVSYFEKM
jgi:hypothetical protein